jgi:hypothetical protein
MEMLELGLAIRRRGGDVQRPSRHRDDQRKEKNEGREHARQRHRSPRVQLFPATYHKDSRGNEPTNDEQHERRVGQMDRRQGEGSAHQWNEVPPASLDDEGEGQREDSRHEKEKGYTTRPGEVLVVARAGRIRFRSDQAELRELDHDERRAPQWGAEDQRSERVDDDERKWNEHRREIQRGCDDIDSRRAGDQRLHRMPEREDVARVNAPVLELIDGRERAQRPEVRQLRLPRRVEEPVAFERPCRPPKHPRIDDGEAKDPDEGPPFRPQAGERAFLPERERQGAQGDNGDDQRREQNRRPGGEDDREA